MIESHPEGVKKYSKEWWEDAFRKLAEDNTRRQETCFGYSQYMYKLVNERVLALKEEAGNKKPKKGK